MSNKKDRHENRVVAMKILFSYLVREPKPSFKDLLNVLTDLDDSEIENDFAEALLESALENLGKVRLVIRAFAPEFSFDKIAPINRALLILGITELKYFDTPPIVVINEYIEIAKEFGEEKSAGFINGVLDSFRKSIGKEREKDE